MQTQMPALRLGLYCGTQKTIRGQKSVSGKSNIRGTRIWKRCFRRVHTRVGKTLEILFTHRLHLGRRAGGKTPGGRFCNVFKFRDGRISSLHIYLDPDYTGEDEARFRWGKNRQW